MLAVIYLILKQKTTKYLSRKILLLTSNELFYIYLCLEKEEEFFKKNIDGKKILEKAFSTRNAAFLTKLSKNDKLLDHSNIEIEFVSCFPLSVDTDLEDAVFLRRKDINVLNNELYEIIIKNDHLKYFKEFYNDFEDEDEDSEFVNDILDLIVEYKSFKIFEYIYKIIISKCETPHGLISFIHNKMFEFVILYYKNFNLAEYLLKYDLENKETIIFLKNNKFILEKYNEEFVDLYNKTIEKIKEFN